MSKLSIFSTLIAAASAAYLCQFPSEDECDDGIFKTSMCSPYYVSEAAVKADLNPRSTVIIANEEHLASYKVKCSSKVADVDLTTTCVPFANGNWYKATIEGKLAQFASEEACKEGTATEENAKYSLEGGQVNVNGEYVSIASSRCNGFDFDTRIIFVSTDSDGITLTKVEGSDVETEHNDCAEYTPENAETSVWFDVVSDQQFCLSFAKTDAEKDLCNAMSDTESAAGLSVVAAFVAAAATMRL